MESSALDIVSPFPFFKQFAKYTQDVTATVILGHLFHLDVANDGDARWHAITSLQWHKALGTTRRKLEGPMRKLVEQELILIKRQGIPPINHYKINMPLANQILELGKEW